MTPSTPPGAGPVALTRAALAALALAASASAAAADCRIQIAGSKCETVAEDARFEQVTLRAGNLPRHAPPGALAVPVGEPLPYDYMMLINSEYFGLPPVSDGWVYFRVNGRVVRADYDTRVVIEDVTSQTNRAFF